MLSVLSSNNYGGFNWENVTLIRHNCVLCPSWVNFSGKKRESWAIEKRRQCVGGEDSSLSKQEGDQESKRNKLQSIYLYHALGISSQNMVMMFCFIYFFSPPLLSPQLGFENGVSAPLKYSV